MNEREREFPFFISYVCVSYDCYYLKREREREGGQKREILRLIVCIEPSRRQELLLLIDSKSMKNERRVYRTEKERGEGEWLIDWNNTSRYKGGKKGLWPWIITFWSSEQASMFGSNIILTSKMLTLMLGHRSSLALSLFDILGRVRSLTLTAEVCTYWDAFEQCRIEIDMDVFALSSSVKIYPMFSHLSLFSGAHGH